jgi:phosphoribosylglycinamide formyltransferase-1
LAQEHAIYPAALRLAASGAVRAEGNRVLGAGGRDVGMVAPDLD